jgi:tRNA/tmRNA/rRNA uracil-C5-methylase (TrmA/RlmC/RlmD family)
VDKIKEYSKVSAAKHIAVAYQPAGSEISTSENFFMVKGSDMLSATLLGKRFLFSVQGFFQNNPAMAERMLGYVNDMIKVR